MEKEKKKSLKDWLSELYGLPGFIKEDKEVLGILTL